jgi:prepilin-type N-terminal cleavage/methylation domain-containing protein
MASHKTYTGNEQRRNAGFTLIEVLLVLALVSMIVGLTLFFDVNSYRGDAFHAERNILVVALQSARADALNNINQSRHGVAINPDGYSGYVIFEGNEYASSDSAQRKEIPASYPITLDSTSPNEVVFKQLSGDTTFSGELILLDSLRNTSTTISINNEGKIGY